MRGRQLQVLKLVPAQVVHWYTLLVHAACCDKGSSAAAAAWLRGFLQHILPWDCAVQLHDLQDRMQHPETPSSPILCACQSCLQPS